MPERKDAPAGEAGAETVARRAPDSLRAFYPPAAAGTQPTPYQLRPELPAERRAMKISLRLDTIADNYEAVMPMIREAIRLRDDRALGYRSPGDYVADRFGKTLSRLGVEVRREVVRELTEAGLSTRAVGSVMGVGKSTVSDDLHSGVRDRTPEPEPVPESVPSARTTGVDGKSYPRPTTEAPRKQNRSPLPDRARDAGWTLRKDVERMASIFADDRYPQNAEQVTAHVRGHLTHAVEVCQDLLDQINTARCRPDGGDR